MADRNAAAVRTYVVEVETAALVCTSHATLPDSRSPSLYSLKLPRIPQFHPSHTPSLPLPAQLTNLFSSSDPRSRRHPLPNAGAQRILALRQATNSRHQRSRKASRSCGHKSRSRISEIGGYGKRRSRSRHRHGGVKWTGYGYR